MSSCEGCAAIAPFRVHVNAPAALAKSNAACISSNSMDERDFGFFKR